MRGACVPSICWRGHGNPGRDADQQILALPRSSCAAASPAFSMLPAARVLHLIEFQSHCAGHAGLPQWALPKQKHTLHGASWRLARARPDSGAPHSGMELHKLKEVMTLAYSSRRLGNPPSLLAESTRGSGHWHWPRMMTLLVWAPRGQVEPGGDGTKNSESSPVALIERESRHLRDAQHSA